MTDISFLCMECLGATDENGICPDCGDNTAIVQSSPLLPLKTVLAQRYVIAKMQKHNDEGITYSAYDLKLDKKVSIREFFPGSLANRDSDGITVIPKKSSWHVYTQYFESFLGLWNKLLRLKGLSSLITVTNVFEANATAYAVYDESERITLRDWLLSTKEGYITWDRARLLFMPVLSTLGTLHTSGIIHRGINPASFIFSSDGKLKITDFCIEPVRSSTSALNCELFEGYTPFEQYSCNEQTGPAADIYSFCCVLYRALIGTTPIDAPTRAANDQMMIPAKFAELLPVYVINGLINGMEIKQANRTENVEQLRSDLSASPRAMAASAVVNNGTNRIQGTAEKSSTASLRPTPPAHPSDTQNPNATKKINPLIMPISPEPAANGNEKKTVGTQSTAKPDNKKAVAEKSGKKRNNTFIAFISGCAVILILAAVVLISSLVGRPVVGGVKVPQFVGEYITELDLDSVREYLQIETIQSYSTEYPANCIMAQSISDGTRVSKNTVVTLTVSMGPQIVTIPDITDMTYEEAANTLSKLGLVSKLQNYISADTSQYGKIYEVVPSVGSYVNQGDTVLIVVYAPPTGEEQTTSPQAETGDSVKDFFEHYQY